MGMENLSRGKVGCGSRSLETNILCFCSAGKEKEKNFQALSRAPCDRRAKELRRRVLEASCYAKCGGQSQMRCHPAGGKAATLDGGDRRVGVRVGVGGWK